MQKRLVGLVLSLTATALTVTGCNGLNTGIKHVTGGLASGGQRVSGLANFTGLPLPVSFGRIHRLHLHGLPRLIPAETQYLANGNIVAAGDRGVSKEEIANASQLINQSATPLLQSRLGAVPHKARVVLFSKQTSYAAALSRAGVPQNQISQMVQETGGLTVGSDVWIPLFANRQSADLANVLAHELTHVVFNQQGIGDTLPTWVNEGTAWEDGLTVESGIDQARVEQMDRASMQQMTSASDLFPLTASEQDILNAPYNVEYEDYLAVQNLVQSYGTGKYESFLSGVKTRGVNASFQATFGMPIGQYETQFLHKLQTGQG